MNAEIICVATDTLSKEHISFISSYISKKLFALGHRTLFETVCPPSCEELKSRITQAFTRSDITIILGGIEPEVNSVAKNAAAMVTGIPLVTSDTALSSLKEYFASIGSVPDSDIYAQAIMLKDARVFKNDLGICCGMSVEYGGKKLLLLPSAEGELFHMFENYVAASLGGTGISVTRTVNTLGLSKAELEQKLSALSSRGDFSLITEKQGAEYAVRIIAAASTPHEAENICTKAVNEAKALLGDAAYAVDSKGLQFEAVRLLSEHGLTVATAESCTGGMVSEMLTSVSGSSKVFEYGLSAYSNRMKQEVLSVPSSVLEVFGAVSRDTAMYMAKNVREMSGASLGIGITGNAGPEPSESKPVGLVYVAIADSKSYLVKQLSLPPELSRDEIRAIAAATAIDLVRKYLLALPGTLSGMTEFVEPTPAQVRVPEAAVTELFETEVSAESETADEITPVTEPEELDLAQFTMIFDRVSEEDENELPFDPTASGEYDFANKKRFSFSVSESKEKTLAVFKKVLAGIKSVIPMKGDPVKRIIIKSGFILSLVCLIVSTVVLIVNFTHDAKQRDIIEQAQEMWNFTEEVDENDNYTAFEPFAEANEDIRGWITIPGTLVDNPIYQTTDNDYYLTHNMNKETSRYGALFFDYRCSVSKEAPTQNVTVYGHNTKDGSMFGTLRRYKSLSFYKENPTFTVTTLNQVSTYKIFSVMIMNATAADDNGYLYNFTTPTFETQEKFMSWIAEARERSIINTEVDVIENDEIITLVTCTYDFDNARLVIMARKTRSNEANTVSTSDAVLNPNPRYPQAWYDEKGLDGYSGSSSTVSDTSSQDIPTVSDTPVSSDVSSGTVTSSGAAVSSTPVQSQTSSAPTAVSSAPAASVPQTPSSSVAQPSSEPQSPASSEPEVSSEAVTSSEPEPTPPSESSVTATSSETQE